MLKFSKANAKLDQLHDVDELQYWLQDRRKVYSFDLISGWSCPQAKDCLSKVHVINADGKKKLIDGKDCKFRCFSASQEATFPNVYKKRKHNFDVLRLGTSSYEIANAILKLIACNELDSTEDAIRTYLETYVPNSHHMTKSKVVKQVCNRTTIYRRVVTWDYANLVKAVSNVKYYTKGVARYIIGGIFDKKRNAVGWSVGEGYTYDYIYNALLKFYNEGKKSYFIHHVKTPTKKHNLAQKRAKIIKLIAEEEKAMIKAVEYYKENGVFPWHSEAFIFQDNENGEEGFLSIRDAIKDSKTGRVADLDDPLTESEIKMVTGEKEE